MAITNAIFLQQEKITRIDKPFFLNGVIIKDSGAGGTTYTPQIIHSNEYAYSYEIEEKSGVGIYSVIFRLNNPSTTSWSDGTKNDLQLYWMLCNASTKNNGIVKMNLNQISALCKIRQQNGINDIDWNDMVTKYLSKRLQDATISFNNEIAQEPLQTTKNLGLVLVGSEFEGKGTITCMFDRPIPYATCFNNNYTDSPSSIENSLMKGTGEWNSDIYSKIFTGERTDTSTISNIFDYDVVNNCHKYYRLLDGIKSDLLNGIKVVNKYYTQGSITNKNLQKYIVKNKFWVPSAHELGIIQKQSSEGPQDGYNEFSIENEGQNILHLTPSIIALSSEFSSTSKDCTVLTGNSITGYQFDDKNYSRLTRSIGQVDNTQTYFYRVGETAVLQGGFPGQMFSGTIDNITETGHIYPCFTYDANNVSITLTN